MSHTALAATTNQFM